MKKLFEKLTLISFIWGGEKARPLNGGFIN